MKRITRPAEEGAATESSLRAEGTGTMQLYFLDALYRLTEAEVAARSRIEGL